MRAHAGYLKKLPGFCPQCGRREFRTSAIIAVRRGMLDGTTKPPPTDDRGVLCTCAKCGYREVVLGEPPGTPSAAPAPTAS